MPFIAKSYKKFPDYLEKEERERLNVEVGATIVEDQAS